MYQIVNAYPPIGLDASIRGCGTREDADVFFFKQLALQIGTTDIGAWIWCPGFFQVLENHEKIDNVPCLKLTLYST